jgi:PAS domain S-box-containing protein
MTKAKTKLTITPQIIIFTVIFAIITFSGLMVVKNGIKSGSFSHGEKTAPFSGIYIFSGFVLLSLVAVGYILFQIYSWQQMINNVKKKDNELKKMVGLSFDLIGIIDLDHNWIEVNSACKSVLGYSEVEILNNSFFHFIYLRDLERVKNLIENFKDGQPGEFIARYLDKENGIRWIEWNYISSTTDKKIYLTGRDMTEIKRSNQVLSLKNYQLDLAGIITDWENQRNEQSLKEESVLLRSQVQSIAGYLEIVINDAADMNPELKEFLNLSLDSVNSLLDSVENIIELKYSKISDVSFKKVEFSINEIENILKQRVVESYKETGLKISYDFNVTTGILVFGDSMILTEVLMKIIRVLMISSGEKLIILSSYLNYQTVETGILVKVENINIIPEFFKIEGIKADDTSDDYNFSGDTWPIFIAKSLINVMNGKMMVYNENNSLSIDIRLPIASPSTELR